MKRKQGGKERDPEGSRLYAKRRERSLRFLLSCLLRLVFAGQQDHVVREIEYDFFEREIGKGDLLGINDVAIAVVTGQGG